MQELNFPTLEVRQSVDEIIVGAGALPGLERDHAFAELFLAGNIPQHMRSFVPVSMTFNDRSGVQHSLTLNVLPDYVSIGDDTKFVRVPLDPMTAQGIANACDCILPTTKIVNMIWSSAQKIAPLPWGPPYDASMMSTDRLVRHSAMVDTGIATKKLNPTALIAGHKKDVVITNRMIAQPQKVAIYGWTTLDGNNIQPLSLVHEITYRDYSHGIRLVSKTCILDGVEDDLIRILKNPTLCVAVSGENTVMITSY